MTSISWFEVILWWALGLFIIGMAAYFYGLMLPEVSSAPIIKAFFEGPQIYLIFLLLLPSLRRLLYLPEYPRFVRENIIQLIENPQKLDSAFERTFIKLSFGEAILFPIFPAILQVLMSGSSIVAFIFPWIFYLFGEFFFLLFFVLILKLLGQYVIPKTLFKLHLIGKPISGASQSSKPKQP